MSTRQGNWQLVDSAPREDRAVLIDPPLSELDSLIDGNLQLRGKNDYDFQGRSLRELSAAAREELLRNARRWTAAYRDIPPQGTAPPELIFLAGHQPQLFHPGVWLKNFGLGHFAERYRAAAVNLIIDSDTVKSTVLRVPGGSAQRPQVELIPFDRPEPVCPYEERRITDREVFAAFGSRVAQRIRRLVPDPLMGTFWQMVLDRIDPPDSPMPGELGRAVAQARHQLEGQWGLETLEVPQSWVCATESFCWLTAHLLAQLPRLSQVYNEVVEEYRRAHRIRNSAQPVPNLSVEGDWLEAPLWIWTADSPQRRPLFARRRGPEILLSDDRGALEISLPLRPEGDAAAAVGRLVELGRQGIKIRSRALITTLWARLALGDLFVHGIGGAKYDQVTDLLIERFLGLTPPRFLVLSATMQLPVARQRATAEDARSLRQQLRELEYHPENHIAGSRVTPAGGGDPAELIAAKARWVREPATADIARARCRAIRQINATLQPWVAPQRSQLQARQAETLQALKAAAVLAWREYGFALYPENTLREFIAGLLCKNS